MPRLCSSLLSLVIASSAQGVTMAWTPVGNPGNGSVGYEYSMGTYEVTNVQYAEFLNAKASVSDPLGLYNPSMGVFGLACTSGYCDPRVGGIARFGGPGSYSYVP